MSAVLLTIDKIKSVFAEAEWGAGRSSCCMKRVWQKKSFRISDLTQRTKSIKSFDEVWWGPAPSVHGYLHKRDREMTQLWAVWQSAWWKHFPLIVTGAGPYCNCSQCFHSALFMTLWEHVWVFHYFCLYLIEFTSSQTWKVWNGSRTLTLITVMIYIEKGQYVVNNHWLMGDQSEFGHGYGCLDSRHPCLMYNVSVMLTDKMHFGRKLQQLNPTVKADVCFCVWG